MIMIRPATRTEQLRVGAVSLSAAVIVRLGAEEPPPSRRLRLVLVLDRSPSMTGPRLRAAVRAGHEMVALLHDGDEVGLVSFDRGLLVRPPVTLDDAARAQLHAALDAMTAGDGSLLDSALHQAARLARRAPAGGLGHVLVISDGVAARLGGDIDTRGIAPDATLSALVINADASDADVAATRLFSTHGLLHVGELDAVSCDLADHVARLRHIATGMVDVDVQIERGFVHDGAREPRSEPFALPAMAAGATRSVAFDVELIDPLPQGRTQVGLVTVHATTLDGVRLVSEQPLMVETSERVGRLDPDVVRAQCLRDAQAAVRLVVDRGHSDESGVSIAPQLFEWVGTMKALAEAAGLDDDRATTEAIALVRRLASDVVEAPAGVDSGW